MSVGPPVLPAQMRGFKVSEFSAYQNAVGHLRTNAFLIVIPQFPPGMTRFPNLLPVQKYLEFTCDQVNFPSTGVETYNVQRYSYGAIETKPTIPRFNHLECTFICDRQTDVLEFFHEWIRVAVNYDFGDSINSISTSIGGHGAVPYEIGYKEEYAVDMFLKIYDELGQQQKHIRFREAYPTMVGDIPLSWGRKDELMKIPVSFTFFDWHSMGANVE
jgi:hypothetical protein